MRRRVVQVFVAAFTLIFLAPRPSLAQWSSWYEFGTEGSYVHETAHLLFAAALIFFIYEIFHSELQQVSGVQIFGVGLGLAGLVESRRGGGTLGRVDPEESGYPR